MKAFLGDAGHDRSQDATRANAGALHAVPQAASTDTLPRGDDD
jgi:hypothetical protein